jgi:hypothetical protein
VELPYNAVSATCSICNAFTPGAFNSLQASERAPCYNSIWAKCKLISARAFMIHFGSRHHINPGSSLLEDEARSLWVPSPAEINKVPHPLGRKKTSDLVHKSCQITTTTKQHFEVGEVQQISRVTRVHPPPPSHVVCCSSSSSRRRILIYIRAAMWTAIIKKVIMDHLHRTLS